MSALGILVALILTPMALLWFLGGLLVSGLNGAMQALWDWVEA